MRTLFDLEPTNPTPKKNSKSKPPTPPKSSLSKPKPINSIVPQREEKRQPLSQDFSYLEALNEVQRQAVATVEGPVMIVAGPGSGKTRVLTFRIAHLINLGYKPYHILSLTFTNKAAREMKDRIQHIVGNHAKSLWMGTFHSVFARILRIEAETLGYPSNFTIYDTEDAKNLLKQIIKERNLNKDLYAPNLVMGRISNAKNNLLTPTAYLQNEQLKLADAAAKRPQIGELYRIYVNRCRQAGAMDFDDLLIKMYELLYHHPDMAAKYQQRFKHVMVDEFQDTNFAQYAVIKKLAEKHENICVVGDDAQSIYAFRGATIQNILNFEKDYKALKTFKLEQNYRSTKHIVEIANEIIANNQNQLKKKIWTGNDTGQKIRLWRASGDTEEAKQVAESIHVTKLREHFKNEDFAILYRTNAQSRVIEEALRKRNIPYRVYGGLSFYQRKEIKDLMAYLRLTVNPYDEEALRRVINYPTRGIGKTTLTKVMGAAVQLKQRPWDILVNIGRYQLATRTKQSIKNFVQLIKHFTEMMQKMNAYELAKYIGKTTKIVQKLHTDKSVEGISRYENIQELFNSIQQFVESKQSEKVYEQDEETGETIVSTNDDLGGYLQEVSLLTNMDGDDDDNDKVKMMTIHSAKGLEFPCVYIVGLEENLFPSQRSIKANDVDEERRLFYVAVTRAEKNLHLSYATARPKFGSLQYAEPSRFLQEIPQQYVELIGSKPQTSIYKSDSYQSFSNSMKNSIKSAKQRFQSGNTPKPPVIPNFKPTNPSLLKEGMQVLHQRFGLGKLTAFSGRGDKRMAVIVFEQYGEKRILLRFAKLMVKP